MSWNQLTVDVPEGLADAIVGELSDDGAAGVWESAGSQPGIIRLVFYFPLKSDLNRIQNLLRNIFDRCSAEYPRVVLSVVEDCDWTGEWKKSYRSFEIGRHFFVIPSWAQTDCPEDRLPVWIDPGQAFGTGTHETTQLTIEALERWVEPSHTVLDIGTGSGILAIAARLLGAKEVFACDIDSVAVAVARANVERNAENQVWTFCGSADAVQDISFPLILCNLTADLIIKILPEIDRVLRPHGIAIFSGVLTDQNEQIREAISSFNFIIHEEIARGEWLALVTEKHVG